MCGIFGIFGHPEAANLTYLGLHGLQHRGQESAGIACSDRNQLRTFRGMGLVSDVFDQATLSKLKGPCAIGHVRYSTSGDSDLVNAQPLAVRHARGQLAIAHNGNLVNAGSLRRALEKEGSIFSSNADSEVVVHLFARTRQRKIVDRISESLKQVRGAYSLLFLTERKLIAARDPYGFRPLCIGRIKTSKHDAWVFSSESGVFDLVGAEYVCAMRPGEIAVVDREGINRYPSKENKEKKFCVFEHVYFSRPDARLGDTSVYDSRRAMGRYLSREHFKDADMVIPVPDSGTAAALGFAQASKIPFEMGLIRSHYVGRTFIEPEQSVRSLGVRRKLTPIRQLIDGKRIVVVDDSLVRGTTSRNIISMLRGVGAAEVHLRISSPPVRYPCYYGIDIPTTGELIANGKAEYDVRRFVGCDSLGYLSLDGLLLAVKEDASEGRTYCDACFSGKYPVPCEKFLKLKPLPLLK
jgi:amidophosphoribosyltransferase